MLRSLFRKNPRNSEPDPMKFLIVGLGNPGAEYRDNRHNVGFMVVDELAAQKKKEFEPDRHGYSCTLKHAGRTLVLLKPTTYMNLSGKAVRYHLQDKKISPQNLLVVTDDIALDFGKVRIRGKGSHGGHNGLRNIEEVLGNGQYSRMRFGVGHDFHKGQQADYVLANFPPEEMTALDETYLPKMAKAILSFATQGLARTMNNFNG